MLFIPNPESKYGWLAVTASELPASVLMQEVRARTFVLKIPGPDS
jgi:hypothetical protein